MSANKKAPAVEAGAASTPTNQEGPNVPQSTATVIPITGTEAPQWATSTSLVGTTDSDEAEWIHTCDLPDVPSVKLQLEQSVTISLTSATVKPPALVAYFPETRTLTVDEARALARALVTAAAQLEKIEQDAVRARA